MLRIIIAVLAVASIASGETFSFEIAGPVAARDFRFKTAAFVFRSTGCSEPARTEVSATAEGIVNGARKSVNLTVSKASNPGVFAVFQQWSGGGKWVVSLKGSCDGLTAGAVVPVGPKGFVRDAARFFSHPPTSAEVQATLEAPSDGGSK